MCAFCEGVLVVFSFGLHSARRGRRRPATTNARPKTRRGLSQHLCDPSVPRRRRVPAKRLPIVRGRYSASRRKQAARRRRSAPHIRRWTNSRWWTSSAPGPSEGLCYVETRRRASSWSSKRSAAPTRRRGTKLDGRRNYSGSIRILMCAA